MDSLQNQIPDEILISRIMQIHSSLSKLDSLKPSDQVNSHFSCLLKLCTLPCSIDVKALPQEVQLMRKSLITLCSRVEGSLETKFAAMLAEIPQPLHNLNIYPYYDRYIKIANLEYGILKENGVVQPKKLAFVGSGPIPLSSIIMATHHMKSTHFDNFDIDAAANDVASRIVGSDAELEKRMKFVTCDIMEVKEKLKEYDCIFLAALVEITKEDKIRILEHIRKYMKEGGVMLLRSAKGAGAFLYPLVEEKDLLDFESLSIFLHTSDVMCSVVVRKPIFQH
ncbi:hypothetical protein LWI28_024769 [Acer negundo]|uniref:Nicotianamine synthase n=1 Tax=Acer negundo TaxID=4023 RepID=A0AAD5JAZ6_ACENE|nr:hypothetical protein LWI28_024769 [Acer negundo]KAK4859440.1 hypothetical protein QYF36_005507 [Acer negundo]